MSNAPRHSRVPCPTCRVSPGESCRDARHRRCDPHAERVIAGDRAAADLRNARRNRSRGSISVSAATFALLKAEAARLRCPLERLMDARINAALEAA